MPLSEGDQGYSVAEGKNQYTPPVPHTDTNFTAKPAKAWATANGVSVDPQFSDLGDIKPTHGNKGSKHDQPSVGYSRAD